MICIRSEPSEIPYISVEKVGEKKPLFTSKTQGYNTYNKANMNFHILKGDNNIYYLLSFRTSPKNSKNGEGIVTEINLDSKKTKEEVVARIWYAIIDKNNDHYGMGMKLTTESYGNISGTFNYR